MKIESFVLEDISKDGHWNHNMDFKSWKVYNGLEGLCLKPYFYAKEVCYLNKENIKSYEVITKESYVNGASAVIKGGLASMFLGAPGLLAGLSANRDDVFWIAIEWSDGARSLLQLNAKDYYQLIRTLF